MSFYWKNSNYKQNNRLTTSLQTNPYSHKLHILFCIFIKEKILQHGLEDKRMSLFTWKNNGSMTVEAAFVLPLFLMVACNLLSVISGMKTESELFFALDQTAEEMATYGYLYNRHLESDNEIVNKASSIVFSNLYARNNVIEIIGKEKLDKSMIVGGSSGISFLRSKVMEDEIIDLIATYKMEAPFDFVGFSDFKLISRCRIRAWTGYVNPVNNVGNKETMVYITKTGSVYHTNINCRALTISVKSTSLSQVQLLRNKDGSIYNKCGECKGSAKDDKVYITDWGEDYHESINCSGLKRTIITISISEIGNRALCKYCGNNQ